MISSSHLRCRIAGHAWVPYGPPPRYMDYLPHLVRCKCCGGFQHASGNPINPDYPSRLRPYPEPTAPGEPTGWARYRTE